MASNIGWIKLHRRVRDHWLWKRSKKLSWLEAFEDLLMDANHHDSKMTMGFKLIAVRRGQVMTTQMGLAKRWGWNRKSVAKFFHLLKADTMVDIETHTGRGTDGDTRYTLITILNYEKYQGEPGDSVDTNVDTNGDTNVDTNGDGSGTHKGHIGGTSEEETKKNTKKNTKKLRRESAHQTPLPFDFSFTDEHADLAQNIGVDIENQLRMFLSNAKSKNVRSYDWNAEFTKWLSREREFQRNGHGRVSKQTDQLQQLADADLGDE